MNKEATIEIKIGSPHIGNFISIQKTNHVALPADVIISVDIGNKKGRLVIAVTEDGILNLGDPDKSMWTQEPK